MYGFWLYVCSFVHRCLCKFVCKVSQDLYGFSFIIKVNLPLSYHLYFCLDIIDLKALCNPTNFLLYFQVFIVGWLQASPFSKLGSSSLLVYVPFSIAVFQPWQVTLFFLHVLSKLMCIGSHALCLRITFFKNILPCF
jgi:hypothetical protein